MPGHSKHVVFNSRERVLSTDFGTMQALLDAQIADTTVAGAAKGHSIALVNQGISGILDGFGCLPDQPGVNSVVRIAPGIAYKVVVPADPSTDSRYQRIESPSNITVDLQPFRAAQPRWVCISIRPRSATVVSAAREFWNSLVGSFTLANVPKIVASDPEVVVTTGAAAATPALPDGVPGVIPLAYVYLAALPAATLAVTDFVLCRPLYGRIQPQPGARAEGGGVTVPTLGATTVTMRRAAGSWGPIGTYSVSSALSVSVLGSAIWESGQQYTDLTGNNINRSVSFYACAPPWPLGFDQDIVGLSREFTNLTPFFSGGASGLTQGCVVACSTGGPTSSTHLGTTGNITLTDPIWGSGGTSSSAHYLGSVTYIHNPQGLLPQSVNGADVTFTTPATSPLQLLTGAVNAGVVGPFTVDASNVNNNGACYPPFTAVVDVGYLGDAAGAATRGILALSDDTDPAQTFPPLRLAVVGEDERGRARLWVGTTGDVVLNAAESAGFNLTYYLYALGYRDPILAQR